MAKSAKISAYVDTRFDEIKIVVVYYICATKGVTPKKNSVVCARVCVTRAIPRTGIHTFF